MTRAVYDYLGEVCQLQCSQGLFVGARDQRVRVPDERRITWMSNGKEFWTASP